MPPAVGKEIRFATVNNGSLTLNDFESATVKNLATSTSNGTLQNGESPAESFDLEVGEVANIGSPGTIAVSTLTIISPDATTTIKIMYYK